MTSPIPVTPPVIQSTCETTHSAASTADPIINVYLNDSISGSSSHTDSDSSDDDGTVYADTKESFAEVSDDSKQLSPRPNSSMSSVSNTHTDYTSINSQENSTCDIETSASNTGTVIPELNVESASSCSSSSAASSTHSSPDSSDSESEIEKTNIDDLVSVPTTPNTDNSTVSDHDISTDDSSAATTNEHAATLVEEAMKAAMDIIRNSECEENNADISNIDKPSGIDCDRIHVDPLAADTDNREFDSCDGGGGEVEEGGGEVIDDSDEADALSASSLD